MIPKWNSLHSFLGEVFMDLRRPYWAQWSRNHWYFLRYVHLDHTFIRGSCYFPLNHCYWHLKFKDNYLQSGTDFCFQEFKWTFLTEGACVCSLHSCFFQHARIQTEDHIKYYQVIIKGENVPKLNWHIWVIEPMMNWILSVDSEATILLPVDWYCVQCKAKYIYNCEAKYITGMSLMSGWKRHFFYLLVVSRMLYLDNFHVSAVL